MAHFQFRTLDELRTDIAERAYAIGAADDLARIRDPVRIADRVASNRMAVHPMEGCDGNADGTPGELTFRRWRRFAQGGAAAALWIDRRLHRRRAADAFGALVVWRADRRSSRRRDRRRAHV